ncbi:MAG: serine/threonine-protein phosphatase [Eubacteriales bacterium]|nr:serine/threonine-protein phosphatase [Eubacteriales bacterium]
MSYIVSWYWDRGSFREKNEDSFSLQHVRAGGEELALLLVCDGIGGLPEGECASGLAAELLTEWFYREGIRRMTGPFWRRRTVRAAKGALEEVQEKLERCEREEEICSGTTCTMALVRGNRFVLLHLGDSRAYRIGARQRQLTDDHQEGGVLRRCLGAFGMDEPDVVFGRLRKGELLLLCTDGFCRRAPEAYFAGCLAGEREKRTLYRRLKGTGSFLEAQGEKDNMTAVLLRCEGGKA